MELKSDLINLSYVELTDWCNYEQILSHVFFFLNRKDSVDLDSKKNGIQGDNLRASMIWSHLSLGINQGGLVLGICCSVGSRVL